MNTRAYRLLIELLSQPTAPFRETHIVDIATRALSAGGVPWFLDPIGNVVVGCAGVKDYRRLAGRASREPLRMLIAHMDHPGFHGLRWSGTNRLRVEWHGGSPVKHLTGARVWLATRAGPAGYGVLSDVRLSKARRAIAHAQVRLLDAGAKRPPAAALYGGFAFRAPVWRRGRRLYTKAADDLIGVFAVVHTALAYAKRRPRTPAFLGLLTRAEEVGFVGAIGHFELGWLQRRRPVLCVSLETSRALPGARIGGGPVVRLGDRRTVFDPGALEVLTNVAAKAQPERYQKRIMDGGTCEATAATVYGFPSIGLSVPLGNYHNQGFEGGPDCRGPLGPAPEFVHLDDVEGLLAVCRALLRPGLPWDRPWDAQRRAFRARLTDYRKRL